MICLFLNTKKISFSKEPPQAFIMTTATMKSGIWFWLILGMFFLTRTRQSTVETDVSEQFPGNQFLFPKEFKKMMCQEVPEAAFKVYPLKKIPFQKYNYLCHTFLEQCEKRLNVSKEVYLWYLMQIVLYYKFILTTKEHIIRIRFHNERSSSWNEVKTYAIVFKMYAVLSTVFSVLYGIVTAGVIYFFLLKEFSAFTARVFLVIYLTLFVVINTPNWVVLHESSSSYPDKWDSTTSVTHFGRKCLYLGLFHHSISTYLNFSYALSMMVVNISVNKMMLKIFLISFFWISGFCNALTRQWVVTAKKRLDLYKSD